MANAGNFTFSMRFRVIHIDQLTKEYSAAGMSEPEARLTALREFGSIVATKEECRDMRRVNVVEDLCKDLAYAFRLLMSHRALQ